MGTYGDVKPFLLIAARLAAEEIAVDFLTNENWEDLVLATGANFVPIAPADPAQDARDDFSFFRSNILPSFERSFCHIARLVASERSLSIVPRAGMLGALCAAEKFEVAALRVALQPSTIWATGSGNLPRSQAKGRRLMERASAIAQTIGSRVSPYSPLLRGFRASKGLPKNGSQSATIPTAVLCPDWFCGLSGVAGDGISFAGFPFAPARLDKRHSIAGQGPILLTPGTGRQHMGDFVQYAADLGRVFNRPTAVLIREGYASASAQVITGADLASIIPGATALIHHGGIGTTAEAIRAGVPQLIIPNRFDQPDNAMRVADLGLGGAILKRTPSSAVVANALNRILGDEYIQQQVRVAKNRLKGNDAVGKLIAALKIQAGRSLPSAGV